MSATRFSVALCTYNGARFLAQQLESILAQTRPPNEIIVSDDGSTDTTLRIVDEYVTRATFAVSVTRNRSRLGVGQNFGSAIALCRGDWIVLSDQDDVWMPDRLARLEQAIARDPLADAVVTDAHLIDADGRGLGRTLWEGLDFTADAQRKLRDGSGTDVLLARNVVTGAAFALRSTVRDLVLPIPPAWIHDAWIALLIAATGRILTLAEPGLSYRLHGENQIGVASRALLDRVDSARAMPRVEYADQRDQIMLARDRLASVARADVLARFDEKIAHVDVRATLPDNRARRVPSILRELVSGRYARYSSGFYSALRDLALR